MTVQEPVTEAETTEIEFAVRDMDCFFVRSSAETDCLIFLGDLIHRADGNLLQYFTLSRTADLASSGWSVTYSTVSKLNHLTLPDFCR